MLNIAPKEKMNITPEFPITIVHETIMENDISAYYSHWHEEIELIYFINGTCDVQCNDKIYKAVKNNVFCFNSGDIHNLIIDKPVEQMHIIVNINFINYDFRSFVFENNLGNDKVVAQHIRKIIQEFSQKQLGYELSIKSEVCQILLYLLTYKMLHTIEKTEYNQKTLNAQRINKVVSYILKYYDQDLTTKSLCSIINVSPSWFCHMFKTLMHQSATSYINSIRLTRAEFFLKNSNESISEIAEKIGFKDTNYFSKMFKKQYKMSPLQYRKHG